MTPLHDLAERNSAQAIEAAQQSVERLLRVGLDLHQLTTVSASEATADRLRQAIGQLDAVINGIFALIIELEQRR